MLGHRVLKLALALFAGALVATAGAANWKDLRVDASSEAAFRHSLDSFKKELSPERQQVFTAALADIWLEGTAQAKTEQREFSVAEYYRQLDGLSYGHVQEVIVQNFLPKPGTGMHRAPPCPEDEYLWSIAAARLILPADIHLQAPPNLSDDFGGLLAAGIDDWGGVSPVTADHVNPERPWPALDRLRSVTEDQRKSTPR